MDTRKTGLTMVQVRVETREIIKKLAKAAKLTIPDFLARLVEAAAEEKGISTPQRYATEETVDAEILDGDFREKGKGKPKVESEVFEWKGQKYRFRRLGPSEKDRWELYCRTGTWEAYAEWFERKFGRPWRGTLEWDDYVRG